MNPTLKESLIKNIVHKAREKWFDRLWIILIQLNIIQGFIIYSQSLLPNCLYIFHPHRLQFSFMYGPRLLLTHRQPSPTQIYILIHSYISRSTATFLQCNMPNTYKKWTSLISLLCLFMIFRPIYTDHVVDEILFQRNQYACFHNQTKWDDLHSGLQCFRSGSWRKKHFHTDSISRENGPPYAIQNSGTPAV